MLHTLLVGGKNAHLQIPEKIIGVSGRHKLLLGKGTPATPVARDYFRVKYFFKFPFNAWLLHGSVFTIPLLNLQDIDVGGLSYTVTGLKKYTEYTFRVVAINKHGPGVSTQDVIIRTLSDGLCYIFSLLVIHTPFLCVLLLCGLAHECWIFLVICLYSSTQCCSSKPDPGSAQLTGNPPAFTLMILKCLDIFLS